MNRRDFLAALGPSGLVVGCLSRAPRSGSPTPSDRDGASDPTIDHSKPRLAVHGIPSDICDASIDPDPSIYAITAPAFARDWSGVDVGPAYRYNVERPALLDEQTVVGLTGDGATRAYPLTVLNTHEVVNDDVGEPVLVTFCPLCSSGMVASLRIRGDPTLFAVTGQLWRPERLFARASEEQGRTFGAAYTGGERVDVRHNGNLVMYDAATHTFWSQLLARGICGPLTGTTLDIRPSTVTTWGDWRARHPDGEVLLPPPHSETVEPGEILGSDRAGSA